MRIEAHTDPQAFSSLVHQALCANEAENCLGLGIIDTLVAQPDRYPKFHLLAALDGARVVGAAWMTPPHPLGITAMPDAALAALAEAASGLAHPVTSVVGPRPGVDRFQELWTTRKGVKVQGVMAQRIYRLTAVTPPAGVAGAMRVAGAADRALLERWSLAFSDDCGMRSTAKGAAEAADFAVKQGSRVLWEAGGEPVAMAGFGGKTPSGIRISWVYTPPPQRGKGYASALVAALSQAQLDAGRRFCFLYTDLDNPTSNGIYQKIGYAPVCDSAHYTFA